jgi:predicted transposase/invertase (TIGR01784 family)
MTEGDETRPDGGQNGASLRMTHDAFFKAMFSRTELAVPFFRERMPADLARRIEWDSLRLLKNSFVKPQFAQLHSDLYFSVRLAGRDARIHLLVEHQSTPQADMPLRMLEYIAAALRHELDRTGGKGPLPVVVPFVLNQGPKRWEQPVSLLEYYDLPAELEERLMPYIPDFRLHLHDLATADPADEERNAALRIVLQEMKLVRGGKGAVFVAWLSEQPIAEEVFALLGWMARYLLSADENLDIREIRDTLESNPRLKEGIMTVADKLFKEGLEKGLEKGLEEGIEKGLEEGIRKGELIGRIQSLFEFLGRETHSREELEHMETSELASLREHLQSEYNRRFKNS